MIIDCCNDTLTQAGSTDVPQLTISMCERRLVNNVVFIVKVNPVNLT